MRRIPYWIALACTLLAGTGARAQTGDDTSVKDRPPQRNYGTFTLGASRWPALGGLSPAPTVPSDLLGNFNVTGYHGEISVHRLVAKLRGRDLRLGADFALIFHENKRSADRTFMPAGTTIKDQLNLRSGYVTASVRWMLGAPRRTGLYVSAGAGWYILNLVEQLADGMVVEDYSRRNTFGGYVGGGLHVPLATPSERFAIDVGMKVHFVSYGTGTTLVSENGGLGGPVYTFHAGVVVGF